MKMTVFWDVPTCSLVETGWIFKGVYCLYQQSYVHLWNVGQFLAGHTAQHPPRQSHSTCTDIRVVNPKGTKRKTCLQILDLHYNLRAVRNLQHEPDAFRRCTHPEQARSVHCCPTWPTQRQKSITCVTSFACYSLKSHIWESHEAFVENPQHRIS
jgi:hypothetical protein